MTAADLLARDFATMPDLIRAHAAARPDQLAVADDATGIDYATLDRMMDRVAAALQRDGVPARAAVAILAYPSVAYAYLYLGIVRAGCIAAPIAPSATPAAIAAMIVDCGAPIVFIDEANADALGDQPLDARRYCELAQAHRATHTMLVPVQYQRIMALHEFDGYDLSAFRLKTCTSAPFAAALKADIVARWPGLLIEYYGMTEGGGTCVLNCTEFPDKLHTVGPPAPGHDIRLIDDDGREVARGATGEVVGRSPAMMTGYWGREQATREAEWRSPEGERFIRHGDVGRFDEDGFLILMDRKKDLIISGGFNIYPVDLEAVLRGHPAVADCTVVGTPSATWGETPVGFYVPHEGAAEDAATILAWTNAQLGKTQRLAALHAIDELPRSAIGKVLKRELRDQLAGAVA